MMTFQTGNWNCCRPGYRKQEQLRNMFQMMLPWMWADDNMVLAVLPLQNKKEREREQGLQLV